MLHETAVLMELEQETVDLAMLHQTMLHHENQAAFPVLQENENWMELKHQAAVVMLHETEVLMDLEP